MNVADKNLCQELYELSGWDNIDERWSGYDVVERKYHGVPKYNLGYVLRKLKEFKPQLIFEKGMNQDYAGAWCDVMPAVARADTPENALAKLAIELFKQGILTKEKATNDTL